jgi:putative ABC transport system ATP-binding protein
MLVDMLLLDGIRKRYDGQQRDAVAGVSLHVAAGEFLALMGPSGCGKSTLLHLCGAMDRPTAGRIVLDGDDLSRLDDAALTLTRRHRVGFVFQFFNLLPTLTLAENIALPLVLAGRAPADARAAARNAADRMGITPRLDAYPAQVSGGEMQRAAIARAIVHGPRVLIADEPTGNLDSANGQTVLHLLQTLNRDLGLTVVLATHAPDIAAGASRVVHMRDGRIAEGAAPAAAP